MWKTYGTKNVVDERDSLPQVVLDTIDTWYDVHSNVGFWLEYHCEHCSGENEFKFGYNGFDDPIHIKEKFSHY